MTSLLTVLLLLLLEPCAAESEADRQTVVVVVGAAGEEQYGQQFQEWAVRWRQAAEKAEAHYVEIGGKPESTESDKDRLRAALEAPAKESLEPLWLVLIGHGTFDGRSAKFNLQGSDLSATDLAEWLKPFRRPLAVVNCASASGPFVNQLSGAGRVIVTATKSGQEQNFARFGEHVSRHDRRRECGPGQGWTDFAAGSVRSSFVASRRVLRSTGATGQRACADR